MPVTRIDSVRAATGTAKDSVLHAAEVVAPYAETAMDRATHYAHEARVRIAPKMSVAADQARAQYGAHIAPRIEQARTQTRAHVPPKVDETATRAREVCQQAAAASRPRIEQAKAVAVPVGREATDRGTATLAALRGQVTAKEVRRIIRRRERRALAGRIALGALALGVLAGGAVAAWKWWDKQANPDWLVEPPEATEVPEGAHLASVDGSGEGTSQDAQVRTRQEEARSAERVARERRGARGHGGEASGESA